MRFVSYGAQGVERPALIVGGEMIDLAHALEAMGRPPCSTLSGFLAIEDWRTLARGIVETPRPVSRSAEGERLGPPVPHPSKVIVVGANTYSHLREAAANTMDTPPRQPMILAKAPTAVCGPTDVIVKPRQTSKLDYEVELGVVIGRRVKHVSEQEALDAVAGVTVVNDVSARDVQLAEGEPNTFYRTHYLGKSFDTFCPCGPFLVTLDELPPLETLRLITRVNGEVRQDGSVGELIFSIPKLISFVSNVFTLMPGDLICTGSPKGVAAFMSPPGYLGDGDLVECEIPEIGKLANRIREEQNRAPEPRAT